MRHATALLLTCAVVLLAGCGGTRFATITTPDGDELMLLGHDPVAYFTMGKPVRGDPKHKVSLPDRTYYFVSDEHKRRFEADPARYEPQYGGFCANGAPFGMKLGSDPTEWRIHDQRLFIFGDIVGHSKWALDPAFNVKYADQVWPEIRDSGWRTATLSAWVNRVPWYRTSRSLTDEWSARYPQHPVTFNPGGFLRNIFIKYPGSRAREGFGQPALGAVGIDPCPPACPGEVSQGAAFTWPPGAR